MCVCGEIVDWKNSSWWQKINNFPIYFPFTHTHTHIYIYIYIYIAFYFHLSMFTHLYIYLHIWVNIDALFSYFYIQSYIYIYIYIVIHRQSVSLYQNSSIWLDTQDASNWDRNPPNFTLDLISNSSAISTTCIRFRLFSFFAIGLRSAQFVGRALHYAGGSR